MKLGIFLRRINQWKHCEGTARAAKKRGHDVYVLCWGVPGPKEVARRHNLPSRVVEEYTVLDPNEIWPKMNAMVVPSALDIVLTRGHADVLSALQTTWSDLIYLHPEAWDVVYTWSALWGDWWRQANLYPSNQTLPSNFVPVGLPVAEHLKWMPPPPADWTKSILYYPFPFGGSSGHKLGVGMRWWYRYNGDQAIVRAARRAADRAGCPLVVKAREKTLVPAYTRARADVFISDDVPGEPTGLQLLTQAGLLIHHCSSAVAEAAFAHVPAINVVPDRWNAYDGRGPDFDPKLENNFYSWPGVSERHVGRPFESWPISEKGRKAYIERYLGSTNLDVGDRIVQDLEQRVQRSGLPPRAEV